MLGEAVTLHRRFPYAVLGGFFLFDEGARNDGSEKRASTFRNAHCAFRIFTGRTDPAGRDEQYEHLYIGLVNATPFEAGLMLTEAGDAENAISLDAALDQLLRMVAERDPDQYAVLGPNGELEPEAGVSPLTIARITSSGAVVKGKPPKKPKFKTPTLSLAEPLPEEDDSDNEG
jgi:hypothetical protein